MARLLRLETGVEVHLAARHIVGRSRVSALRLDSDKISGVHAEFTWREGSWQLRDLGSRNGTLLGGAKLEAGELVSLARDMVVNFGSVDVGYRVLDLEPPRLMAMVDNDEVRLATDGILSLPDADNCAVTIFCDHDKNWVCETDTETRAINDQEHVEVEGQSWRIHLPGDLDRTRESSTGPTLGDIALEFKVSRDQEHVDLSFTLRGEVVSLETRAHAFFLLGLARARLEDAGQAHLRESEHGWRYREDLMRQLDTNQRLLNLWVFRARKQLAGAGVIDASGLIERRADAQQLRIGVGQLTISSA